MKIVKSTALLTFGVMTACLLANPSDAAKNILSKGSHCVAYRTSKTLAFVSKHEIIGENCSISTTVIKQGDKLALKVQVPIKKFDSKEKDRDKEVASILKADKQSNLIYTSTALTKEAWQKMAKKGSAKISGKLNIAGKVYPVKASATIKKAGGGYEVFGMVKTKFTSFGLKPPVVAGGVIAKAPDELELYFRFQSTKVKDMSLAE